MVVDVFMLLWLMMLRYRVVSFVPSKYCAVNCNVTVDRIEVRVVLCFPRVGLTPKRFDFAF